MLLVPHALLGLPPAYVCLWYGMSRLGRGLIEAAEILGASPLTILIRVYLPSIKQYVIAAFFIAFLSSWDESVFPLLLTGPETHTLPKTAFETMRLDRDLTIAAANVFAGIMLSLVLSYILRHVDDKSASHSV